MLDADEMAAYEAWKEHKLHSHPDLSVEAYNAEMGGMANAWDEAVREVVPESDPEKRQTYFNLNPYRQPGMRGHVARSFIPSAVAAASPAIQPPLPTE